MKMKKIIAILLLAFTTLSLTACSVEDLLSAMENVSYEDEENETTTQSDNEETTTTVADGKPDTGEDNELTVESFLKIYGWSESDIKPANFVEFQSVEMDGNTKAGEKGSTGFIKIVADKDATTMEDVNAWFKAFYSKCEEMSEDGKLYKSPGGDEITPLEELMAGPLWESYPGGSLSYPYTLPIGQSNIYIAVRYDMETGIYKISFCVM